MLMKYIEATVTHKSKDYKFTANHLEFDTHSKYKNSIILPEDFIKNDIYSEVGSKIYVIFRNMVNSKIYSSMSNVLRAVRNGTLEAILNITYCTDINRCDTVYGNTTAESWWYCTHNNVIKDDASIEKYCSGVSYEYKLGVNEIRQYLVFGDLYLGDIIPVEDMIPDRKPIEFDINKGIWGRII